MAAAEEEEEGESWPPRNLLSEEEEVAAQSLSQLSQDAVIPQKKTPAPVPSYRQSLDFFETLDDTDYLLRSSPTPHSQPEQEEGVRGTTGNHVPVFAARTMTPATPPYDKMPPALELVHTENLPTKNQGFNPSVFTLQSDKEDEVAGGSGISPDDEDEEEEEEAERPKGDPVPLGAIRVSHKDNKTRHDTRGQARWQLWAPMMRVWPRERQSAKPPSQKQKKLGGESTALRYRLLPLQITTEYLYSPTGDWESTHVAYLDRLCLFLGQQLATLRAEIGNQSVWSFFFLLRWVGAMEMSLNPQSRGKGGASISKWDIDGKTNYLTLPLLDPKLFKSKLEAIRNGSGTQAHLSARHERIVKELLPKLDPKRSVTTIAGPLYLSAVVEMSLLIHVQQHLRKKTGDDLAKAISPIFNAHPKFHEIRSKLPFYVSDMATFATPESMPPLNSDSQPHGPPKAIEGDFSKYQEGTTGGHPPLWFYCPWDEARIDEDNRGPLLNVPYANWFIRRMVPRGVRLWQLLMTGFALVDQAALDDKFVGPQILALNKGCYSIQQLHTILGVLDHGNIPTVQFLPPEYRPPVPASVPSPTKRKHTTPGEDELINKTTRISIRMDGGGAAAASEEVVGYCYICGDASLAHAYIVMNTQLQVCGTRCKNLYLQKRLL
jgi:hypothetical protein